MEQEAVYFVENSITKSTFHKTKNLLILRK